MSNHASTIAAQGRTLRTATNHREPWSQVEIDLLVDCPDEKAEVVAETLGRTLYAVSWVRHALANGIPVGGGAAPAQPPATCRNRAYTFIGNDVPPGWND